MNARFVWKPGQSPADLWIPNMDLWLLNIQVAVEAAITRSIPQIVGWMQQNALWNDRTGLARKSLTATVNSDLSGVSLIVAHGVDYGIYLEVLYEGRYAILGRTVDYWGARIWAEVSGIMS